METVVVVAVAVLTAVFVGSLAALIFVCRHRYCGHGDFFSRSTKDTRPDAQLIQTQECYLDLEMDDVGLPPDLERILADAQWVGDATGLVPHCLAILKTCQRITERLAMAMGPLPQSRQEAIMAAAQKTSPRIDDVVRSLYPPLDARVLEARSIALVLAVSNLALVTRTSCSSSIAGSYRWIDDVLGNLDQHLVVLREAALAQEANAKLSIGNTNTSCSAALSDA